MSMMALSGLRKNTGSGDNMKNPSRAFEKMQQAAHAFIEACEEFDNAAEYDSHEIIEIMEDVSVWIRKVEKELENE